MGQHAFLDLRAAGWDLHRDVTRAVDAACLRLDAIFSARPPRLFLFSVPGPDNPPRTR